MRTVKDVEAYLEKLNRHYAQVDGESGTYLIHPSAPTNVTLPPIAVRVEPPLVVMRVHIGDVPAGSEAQAPLFRKLLELNARALVHASYGLESEHIVLAAALELENLDFNEIEATLDEIEIALAQHVPALATLAQPSKK